MNKVEKRARRRQGSLLGAHPHDQIRPYVRIGKGKSDGSSQCSGGGKNGTSPSQLHEVGAFSKSRASLPTAAAETGDKNTGKLG